MNKSTILLPLSLTVIAPAVAQNANEHKAPNIIIVYCDDLGYGDLGVTGHPNIKTPHLDKMAVNGLRFTNYYSASPASTASRYSLLTGKYPIRSGFGWVLNPDDPKGIHPQEHTLGEAMKQQGYTTAIYGKWHLGSTKKEYLPLQNGFDEYYGLPYSNDMIPPKYQDIALMHNNDTISLNPDQTALTEFYTHKAIDFIKKNKDQRFFVYIPYAMPHTPLFPGKKFQGTSKRGAYGDAVQEIDHYVGELLATIHEENLDKNTIIWFISDNGPWLPREQDGGSAGLFRDGKGSTWDGGMRVPCIVYWNGSIDANQVNDNVVNAMDVYATNIYLAGGTVPKDKVVDGKNVASYLLANASIAPKAPIPFFYYGLNNELMAVRNAKWKLHVKTYSQIGAEYFNKKVPLLFNLDTDPSEKYDLSDKYPEVVEELTLLIHQQNRQVEIDGNYWKN